MQQVRRGGAVAHHKEEAEVTLSEESPGLSGKLLSISPGTQLLKDTALPTPPYPASTKDESQGKLPGTDVLNQDQESMTFEDVAVNFTNMEWQSLTYSQKDLYKDVMLEIYDNMVFLGLLFPKPPLISHLEQRMEPCNQDPQNQECLSCACPVSTDETWLEKKTSLGQEGFGNREVCCIKCDCLLEVIAQDLTVREADDQLDNQQDVPRSRKLKKEREAGSGESTFKEQKNQKTRRQNFNPDSPQIPYTKILPECTR
ncbi:zinc finger protein 311-like, partial [Thomomys bottae]